MAWVGWCNKFDCMNISDKCECILGSIPGWTPDKCPEYLPEATGRNDGEV